LAGDTAIVVNPLLVAPPPVPTPPFPIVIDLERMTVTNVSGGSWTVNRGAGGTTPATHSKFYPDATTPKKVMSTPLPIDNDPTSFYYTQQMRMCIAEEGWSAFPPGANDCPTTPPPPLAPLACVLYSTTIFDIGDGTVIRAP
jgi:hypothetical protein